MKPAAAAHACRTPSGLNACNTRRPRWAPRAVVLAVVACAASALAPAGLQASPAAAGERERVVVRLRAQAPAVARLAQRAKASRQMEPLRAAAALGERAGLVLHDGASVAIDTQVVVGASGQGAAELARRLARDPDVLWAIAERRVRHAAAPNDPLYPVGQAEPMPTAGQWALRARTAATPAAMDVEAAWGVTNARGAPSVVVAVLDTGILRDHPDFAGSTVLPGYDFISDVPTANDGDGRDANPSDPGDWITAADRTLATFSGCTVEDSSWHGSMTAGLIAATADNAEGVAGVAPGVSLLPLRVLGKCGGFPSDIAAAMRWAVGIAVPGLPANPHPAKILNLSLGDAQPCNAIYSSAVEEVTRQGAIVIAAAGNTGGAVEQPANCSGVVAVAGVAHDGLKAVYSNVGPQVAFSAPGGDCPVGSVGCEYPLIKPTDAGLQGPVQARYTDANNPVNGTSFSSAVAAGVAALAWSANPAMTAGQVRSVLSGSALPFPSAPGVAACLAQGSLQKESCACTHAACGAGMLDAAAAVAAASSFSAAAVTGPSTVNVGARIRLSGASSQAAPGQSIASYAWRISRGSEYLQISGGVGSQTAEFTGVSAGDATVELTTRDSAGHEATAVQAISVQAAPPAPPASATAVSAEPAKAGGSMDAGWLGALLALAWAGLRKRRTSAGACARP